MFIIAIAPEVGVACAAQDFWRARELRNKVNLPGFTLTHAFYGLMGGFVLAIPMERAPGNETCPNRTQGEKGRYSYHRLKDTCRGNLSPIVQSP
jgi:hypothetical protein